MGWRAAACVKQGFKERHTLLRVLRAVLWYSYVKESELENKWG